MTRDEAVFTDAFCVYCRAGKEMATAARVNAYGSLRAVVPTRIRRDKENGKWTDKELMLFPSYFFVYAEGEEGLMNLRLAAQREPISLVAYGDGTVTLRGEDLLFARWIWEHNGTIGLSAAVREGDAVRIVEGPLAQARGIIRRVDKRRKLMQIELEINGFTTWLSYDWVDKAE